MERLAADLLAVVQALVHEEIERSKEDVLAQPLTYPNPIVEAAAPLTERTDDA